MGNSEKGATAPYRIESIPAVDLVVCPSCRTVVSLADIDVLEVRRVSVEDDDWLFSSREEALKGVFCPNPGCDAQLFDEESWVEHLVARRVAAPHQATEDGEEVHAEEVDGEEED